MAKIKPKVSLYRNYIAASKQFTDRKTFIESFNTCLNTIKEDDIKVLTYYGVGGIGKSSLRKELICQINKREDDLKYVDIDFEIRQHRVPENALIFMRTELSNRYAMKFPLFDFAYTYYVKKISPHLALNSDNVPFLEEGELLSDVISAFKDIPIVNIAAAIYSVIDKGHSVYKNWGTQKRIDKITDMSSMDANELLEFLPCYFAEDINNFNLDKNDQLVIFMDTYEALWNENKSNFFGKDEWIRDILVPSLPGVLFVILGREKLRWETLNSDWKECLDQHIIGKLAESDARLFLDSCKIGDEDIICKIIDIAKGLPYSLDLCVDTYYTIDRKRPPTAEDFNFEDNQIKIFERFMRHLEEFERETLKALSVTRYWDEEILNSLVKEYNIRYSTLNLQELGYYSFISERTIKNTWEMNSLMRTSLQSCQDENQLKRIHNYLFDFYIKKLRNIDSNNINQVFLNEAYYHGKNCLEIENLSQWLIKASEVYRKLGNISFLSELFQDLYDQASTYRSDSFSELSYILGEIYMYLGKYEKAEEILEANEFTEDLLIKAKTKGLLATLQRGTYKYHLSDNNFKITIDILEKLDDSSISVSILKIKHMIDYGKLKVYLSENEQAIDLYKEAIKQVDNSLEGEEQKYTLLNLKAIALEKLGEVNSVIKNYGVTESSYNEAIEIYDKINYEYIKDLKEDGNIISLMNNKGILYKRLAGFYIKQEKLDQAKLSYKKSLDIYKESRKISPENVDTLKKMGFASRGLLRLLVNNYMDQEEIGTVLKETVGYFDKAIELSPRDVSSIYSKGGAYRIIAKSNMENGEYDQAVNLSNISIDLANKAIDIQPNYIYAYNGKSDSLVAKGEICEIRNENIKALELYKEAMTTIDEVIKRTPKSQSSNARKQAIENKIRSLTIGEE